MGIPDFECNALLFSQHHPIHVASQTKFLLLNLPFHIFRKLPSASDMGSLTKFVIMEQITQNVPVEVKQLFVAKLYNCFLRTFGLYARKYQNKPIVLWSN